MLGVIEARTLNLYSALPSMERYWEAAIRSAPGSPHALDAYALLEEYATTTYGDSLPYEGFDEGMTPLEELRRLIGLE